MKQYTAPKLSLAAIDLSDVILTSAAAPEFSVDADKSAGQATWLDAWNDLL